MNTQAVKSQTDRPVKTPRSLVGGGKFQYRIEVTGWNFKKWGPAPYFGKVWADNEYWAVYEAYDRLNFPPNATFKPKPVKLSN